MTISRQDIINYMAHYFNTNNIVLVDEFETQKARHICPGYKEVTLLSSDKFYLPLPNGTTATFNIYFCPRCRKLYLNKNELMLTDVSSPSPTPYGYSPYMW